MVAWTGWRRSSRIYMAERIAQDEPKDEWSARIACNLRNDKKKKTLKQTLNRALPKQRSNPGDQACLLDPHR